MLWQDVVDTDVRIERVVQCYTSRIIKLLNEEYCNVRSIQWAWTLLTLQISITFSECILLSSDKQLYDKHNNIPEYQVYDILIFVVLTYSHKVEFRYQTDVDEPTL